MCTRNFAPRSDRSLATMDMLHATVPSLCTSLSPGLVLSAVKPSAQRPPAQIPRTMRLKHGPHPIMPPPWMTVLSVANFKQCGLGSLLEPFLARRTQSQQPNPKKRSTQAIGHKPQTPEAVKELVPGQVRTPVASNEVQNIKRLNSDSFN